jgi:Ca-activated chloride channel family protein
MTFAVQGPGSGVQGSRNLLALVICVIESGMLVSAQQTFKTGTRTVAVYATVIDKSGRLVTNLNKENFTVFDNGKPQRLALFSNDPQPITMAAMLDTSGSMQFNVSLVRTATMALVSYLTPEDRVRLGTFGGRIALSPSFTNDGSELARFVWERMRPGGGTPLWDAVDVAMDTLTNRNGRRVVLVFSDGEDSQSKASLKDEMRRAQREAFMVYAIGCWGNAGFGIEPDKPDGGLRKIADETGGGYAELKWTDDLNASFRRVAEELHSQYVIGFSPEKVDGKTHKLDVRVNVPGLTVRTRRNYIAE